MPALTCQRAREIVLSDIAPADDVLAARRHLLTCPECASDTADDIDTRSTAMMAALTPGMLVRRVLLVVSAIQTIIAVPWIFGVAFLWVGDAEESIGHVTRDGVIGFAIGVVGLLVALRPALAYFAISVCLVQVGIQVVTIVFDVVDNEVSPTFELLHLLAVVILALVVAIAFPRRR